MRLGGVIWGERDNVLRRDSWALTLAGAEELLALQGGVVAGGGGEEGWC